MAVPIQVIKPDDESGPTIYIFRGGLGGKKAALRRARQWAKKKLSPMLKDA